MQQKSAKESRVSSFLFWTDYLRVQLFYFFCRLRGTQCVTKSHSFSNTLINSIEPKFSRRYCFYNNFRIFSVNPPPPTVEAQNLTTSRAGANSSLIGENALGRELNHYAAFFFAYTLWCGRVKSKGGTNRKDPNFRIKILLIYVITKR